MVDSPGHTVAGIPLLETKLYIPKWRPGLVSRPRLVDRLRRGIERKLTLVSAPAGFGKTTLLAEWAAAAPASEAANKRPLAWVSLDQADNDPTFFWAYFITALQKVQSPKGQSKLGRKLGQRSLSLLHSPQPPPIKVILTTLINEINTVEDDFALILDDYHVVEAPTVHRAIAFLLDHLPAPMHLVIASRSDPPLPLGRLRGRGELSELRVADLRFTADEAATFLSNVMDLDISAADVAALETRTEGWIAGLQLAALSMQGREDIPGFVAAFSGDDRYIVDYLVEEVLQRQPEHVRNFLLQTAILDRLSGPLCDAITHQKNGKGMLEALERGNLFVVPLDNKRQWYRYHHLFADVLLAHLIEAQPDATGSDIRDRIPTLHRRASEWYEQNGLPFDAIRHALAAKDFERAAGLVELAWPAMRRSRQEATMLSWVKALPNPLIRVRSVLSVVYAWALMDDGKLEAAEARLQDAEQWLDSVATDTTADLATVTAMDTVARQRSNSLAPERVVVDEAQFRSLPAAIANARAYRAQALGDLANAAAYARKALDLLPEDDYYERGTTAALLGLTYWASGKLEAAHQSFADGLASLQMGGGILIRIGGSFILADIRRAQGRLHEAVRTYERSLQLAAEHGERRGTAELYLGLSELYCERGDLETARAHLVRGEALREQASLPGYDYMWRLVKARLQEAQGNLDGALDLLQEAERLYYTSPLPEVRPIAALKVRVWLKQTSHKPGRLAEALSWARERSLSVDDELGYLREYEHITLAQILIAQYKRDRVDSVIHQAIGLLERLLEAAEKGERMGSVIEILVLQAIARAALGDIPRALHPLERALTLAEPEGYVRIFVDEGETMRDLLRQAAAVAIASNYIRQLLSAFDDKPAPSASAPAKVVAAELVEPLTAREVDILRLIAAGLRNQEIADQLFISLATVKRHIANAYGKLGVSHRTQAVARANELNLL